MTVVTRGLDINTSIELGLRFGCLKPIPTGVKTPKGNQWKLYSKDWTRRTVTTRKGKMDTREFLGLWNNCRNHAERCAAFGGLLEEVETEMKEWSSPFEAYVKYREYVGYRKDRTSLDEYGQTYTWGFDPAVGAWVFQATVTNTHADHWLRVHYDVHHWSARAKEETIELEKYLKQRLGID